MKLDSRILEGKKPLTCFDVENAKQFIGKECYLSNSIADYADLNNVTAKRILDDVSNTSIPYSSNPAGIYCYCLPCEWVKESEYRPYTLKEFLNHYHLGDEVIMRSKDNPTSKHVLFVGYKEGGDDVLLGQYWNTFMILFNNYELHTSEGWQPFGVMEDD